jgi:cell division protein FtsB
LSSPSRVLERGRNGHSVPEGVRPRLFTWRRKAATAVAGALALGMGYGVVFGHNGLTAYQQKRAEEHHLHDQTEELQRENGRLRGHVERLQDDPGAIEHQAREELHYTRPGEVIYPLDTAEAGGEHRASH